VAWVDERVLRGVAAWQGAHAHTAASWIRHRTCLSCTDMCCCCCCVCVCQVVLEVLLSAARQGKRFRVLVVDGRPELEGRQMMRRLLQVSGFTGKRASACCCVLHHIVSQRLVGCTNSWQQLAMRYSTADVRVSGLPSRLDYVDGLSWRGGR
jgi:hypothetical protein